MIVKTDVESIDAAIAAFQHSVSVTEQFVGREMAERFGLQAALVAAEQSKWKDISIEPPVVHQVVITSNGDVATWEGEWLDVSGHYSLRNQSRFWRALPTYIQQGE